MPQKEASWYQSAVEAIAREGVTLRQYVANAELALTSIECERIFKSKRFQELLRAEREKYQSEIATTPGRNKTSLLGLAYMLIWKLIEEAQWDKAILGIEKLSKIEGWQGADTNVNIFAGITAQDIDKMKAELRLSEKESKKALDLLN